LDKEYLPITGLKSFVDKAVKLAYGESTDPNLVAASQSISGTGALRIGGEFLNKFHSNKTIYLPTPSWGNHKPIFADSGLKVESYRYYDQKTIGLDINGMLEDMKKIPDNSVVLLHSCAHNPTGVDPTKDQWAQILKVVEDKQHLPFFDMAYQGFATGNIEQDAYALRLFAKSSNIKSILLAQSFAKNMGLYGERVGLFSIKSEHKKEVESQIKILIRPMYSNPPLHGAHIASTILSTDSLNQLWIQEVGDMASRIIKMRELLKSNLKDSKLDWSHITNQIGMFCYTGLKPDQVKQLINEHHIYLTNDGRISMAGVTSENVGYLAKSIFKVTS